MCNRFNTKNNYYCKPRGENIDCQIAHSRMPGRQGDLHQFNTATKQEATKQLDYRRATIAKSKHSRHECKGCKMLKSMSCARNRAIGGRNHGQNHNSCRANPGQYTSNYSITPQQPLHSHSRSDNRWPRSLFYEARCDRISTASPCSGQRIGAVLRLSHSSRVLPGARVLQSHSCWVMPHPGSLWLAARQM